MNAPRTCEKSMPLPDTVVCDPADVPVKLRWLALVPTPSVHRSPGSVPVCQAGIDSPPACGISAMRLRLRPSM